MLAANLGHHSLDVHFLKTIITLTRPSIYTGIKQYLFWLFTFLFYKVNTVILVGKSSDSDEQNADFPKNLGYEELRKPPSPRAHS